MTLDQAGIKSIDLNGVKTSDRERVAGNIIFSRTTATFTNGVIRDTATKRVNAFENSNKKIVFNIIRVSLKVRVVN